MCRIRRSRTSDAKTLLTVASSLAPPLRRGRKLRAAPASDRPAGNRAGRDQASQRTAESPGSVPRRRFETTPDDKERGAAHQGGVTSARGVGVGILHLEVPAALDPGDPPCVVDRSYPPGPRTVTPGRMGRCGCTRTRRAPRRCRVRTAPGTPLGSSSGPRPRTAPHSPRPAAPQTRAVRPPRSWPGSPGPQNGL